MSGLLSAIPGLALHQVAAVSPVSAAVVSGCDCKKAYQQIREMTGTIGAAYPAGALEWLRELRPDIIAELARVEKEIDTAFKAENFDQAMKSAALLERLYLKAFEIFKARPPVVEVQERLI